MFRGCSQLSMDAKGRLAIPTRYRNILEEMCAGKLVVTIDIKERCLLLYRLSDWEVIESKLDQLPSFNAASRRLQRLLIGYACDLELDGQGRFLLPSLLRDYAKLDKQIMLIGQGKNFEIWDESSWQDKQRAWLDIESDPELNLPEEFKTLSL